MSAIADEIYVATDVEADGPIPGPHSLLSFGSVALRADKTVIGEFTANVLPLPGATAHPRTMAWWQQHPQALAAARADAEAPEVVMPRYAAWVRDLPGRPVFVGQPAAWDFLWIYWYLMRFVGDSPFGHSALDAKTYAAAVLKRPYRWCVKKNLPKAWFDPLPHTHVALEDAREQGALFCNMLAANGAFIPPA